MDVKSNVILVHATMLLYQASLLILEELAIVVNIMFALLEYAIVCNTLTILV